MNYITDPNYIEKRSFEIISSELDYEISPDIEPIVKRVIHTTADFEYAKLLSFNNKPLETAEKLLSKKVKILTDTNMILSGINKTALKKSGCSAKCFMSDPDIALEAKNKKLTRAKVSIEAALKDTGFRIFVIGNAPTALFTLVENLPENFYKNTLIIGVPVGFVGAEESKNFLLSKKIPSIVVKGRKGGSTVAVAIMNAILYSIYGR